MANRRTMAMLLVGVLSTWLLSGCILGVAPIQSLPREAFASVTEVALAVGADGIKHYAWTECSGEDATYTCVLVYSRTATGAVLYSYGFVTPIGIFATNPDVAVNDNDDAYVVRSVCSALFDCEDYWSMFPADNPESVEPQTNLLHTSEVSSEGPPRGEGRGDDIYASYFILSSGYPRLRYRQLSGGNRSGLIDGSTLSPESAELAIDANGDLHAVWVRNPVTDTIVAYANNTGGVSNFNAPTTFEAGGADDLITQPRIALDSEERAYIAYTINNGANDTIKVRCRDTALNCYHGLTLLTVPQVDGGWNVNGSVDLELIGLQPQVAFAATHSSLTYSEIWWYRPASTGDTPPTKVTNTANVNEAAPRIVREHSTAGDVPVVAWRQYHNNFLDVQAPSGNGGICYGDVYVLFSSTSNLRRVFQDKNTCANSGFDLASNGPWVAGVWEDQESNGILAHAAWTAFNTYRVDMPVVRR